MLVLFEPTQLLQLMIYARKCVTLSSFLLFEQRMKFADDGAARARCTG